MKARGKVLNDLRIWRLVVDMHGFTFATYGTSLEFGCIVSS